MAVDSVWIIPLIITHLIPYFLLSWIIWIYQKQKDYYQDKIVSKNLVQFGLISLNISMLSEFIWHWLIQGWDYQNESNFLNFLMYFFMNLGFALWSIGLKKERITDLILIILVILTPIAYFFDIKPIIWVAQLVAVIILTIRGYQIIQDKRIYLFIVFSFVVNMIFIMLLFNTNNPLYHILHDILGTLMGLWIFGFLFYINPKRNKISN